MKRLLESAALGLSLLLLPWMGSCRSTSTSSDKALIIPTDGSLTMENWVPSCEAELQDPVSGASSRQQLLELAKTEDCTEAYPAIRRIIDDFTTMYSTQKKTS